MADSGVFTISLDTELAWGSFDKGGVDRHGPAYREVPAVVDRLCDLFERYDVSATWAFVAHLVSPCPGHDDAEPTVRREWLSNAPCQTGADRELWYASELLDRVRSCAVTQDVGLHGYGHLPFGRCDRRTADAELAAAVDVAESVGIDPVSFVYPRNDIAHTDLLSSHGLGVYRGVDARWYERRASASGIRKLCRFADEALGVTPPVVTPVEHDGVVRVPGSQILRPNHGPWGRIPGNRPLTRAKKGLERAAETGQMFHLWWHPFNLASDLDAMIQTLTSILDHAETLRQSGTIDVCSLREIEAMTRAGYWRDGRDEAPDRGERV